MKRNLTLILGVLLMASVGCGKSEAKAEKDVVGEETTAANVAKEVADDTLVVREEAGLVKHEAVLKTVDASLSGTEAFKQIIDSYAGKVVVLDFWATWCPPCRRAMVEIDAIKPALMDKGVVFLYLTGETSPQKDFDEMMPSIHGDHYRLTNSQWSELCNSLNIPGIPAYAVVNKDGSMGYSNLSQGGFPGNEEIQRQVEVALTK